MYVHSILHSASNSTDWPSATAWPGGTAFLCIAGFLSDDPENQEYRTNVPCKQEITQD